MQGVEVGWLSLWLGESTSNVVFETKDSGPILWNEIIWKVILFFKSKNIYYIASDYTHPQTTSTS